MSSIFTRMLISFLLAFPLSIFFSFWLNWLFPINWFIPLFFFIGLCSIPFSTDCYSRVKPDFQSLKTDYRMWLAFPLAKIVPLCSSTVLLGNRHGNKKWKNSKNQTH